MTKLAKLREEKGMTQRQVADALSVDPSTVRNWERNRAGTAMIVQVARLCDLFDCSPWDLVELDQGLAD